MSNVKMGQYLEDINTSINSIIDDDLHSRIKNALRIYYLSFSYYFITNRVLKKINFTGLKLDNKDVKIIENAGWLTDQNYITSVYEPAIKTILINNIYQILQSYDTDNKYSELKEELGKIVKAVENKNILQERFTLFGLERESDGLVDFVTLDFILKIIKEFENSSAREG